MNNILKPKTTLTRFTEAYREIIEAAEAMGNTDFLSYVKGGTCFDQLDVVEWNEANL